MSFFNISAAIYRDQMINSPCVKRKRFFKSLYRRASRIFRGQDS